jgi:hypothetical protein
MELGPDNIRILRLLARSDGDVEAVAQAAQSSLAAVQQTLELVMSMIADECETVDASLAVYRRIEEAIL